MSIAATRWLFSRRLRPSRWTSPASSTLPRRARIPTAGARCSCSGLAATIRLYDGDTDAFVAPSKLLSRIDSIMGGMVERYNNWTTAPSNALGAPFAEILLRPGKDRVSAPFDQIIGGDEGVHQLDLDGNALAVVQLALRPRPAVVWRYAQLSMWWQKQLTPPTLVDGVGTIDEAAVQFTFKTAQSVPIEIVRVADRHRVQTKQNETVYLPTLLDPKKSDQVDDNLTLVVRWRADLIANAPDIASILGLAKDRPPGA